MSSWHPQHFRKQAEEANVSKDVIENAISTARALAQKSPRVAPIFTLRHLAHLAQVPYVELRSVACRSSTEPYRIFKIRKKPLPNRKTRFRTIVIPKPWLMKLQRWINVNILEHVSPHDASFGFSTGNTVNAAAAPHCGARWLIKFDIQNFFENVTERQVFKVFEGIGYQPLVAFELARLCTRVGERNTRANHRRFRSRRNDWEEIPSYYSSFLGHLPQGAPTSPRLANLVAYDLDSALTSLADRHGFIYTRYADDLTLSTTQFMHRESVRSIIGNVYEVIADNGFTPNITKTSVSSPGARKIVLGLLVDQSTPRLTREYKSNLRQHLFYLRKTNIGPAKHAAAIGDSVTVFGLRNHVLGLIQHARQIERAYGDARLEEFNTVEW